MSEKINNLAYVDDEFVLGNYDEEGMIGRAIVRLYDSSDPFACLFRLNVREDKEREGYGRKLVEAAKESIRNLEVFGIVLDGTFGRAPNERSFYEKCGWDRFISDWHVFNLNADSDAYRSIEIFWEEMKNERKE